MSGPSPEEVRAEHAYRGERAREVFAAGTISCGTMRVQVSKEELRRLRKEVQRREKERDAAHRLFRKRRDLDSERRFIEAEIALMGAKEEYAIYSGPA